MDATKAAASTTHGSRDAASLSSDVNPRDNFKQEIKETYKGVPDSLESQSLLSSEYKCLSQYSRDFYWPLRKPLKRAA